MNRKLTLKDLGAENCINLLQPVRCECGCGGYGQIILETEQDVVDLAGTFLGDEDCEHAYIFALTNGGICGAFTDEEGVHAFSMASLNGDDLKMDFDEQIEFVKYMIREIEPHCIGVMQHTEDNRYRIVMEDVYDRKVIKGVKAKRKRRNPYLN